MTIEMQQIPKPKDNFQLEDLDGELLLYHPTHNKSFYLNENAAMIWKLCDGENSVADIIDILIEAFPDAKDQMEIDVINALDEFVAQKAMELKA